MTIPFGGPIWPSDPSSSPTSPTRSKTTPAKVTPRQSGHHREVIRAPPSSVKSQCGAPPTASIPKTRDQPEEPHSKRFRPSGNNASTGTSRGPPTRQQMQGATSDRQHAPHLVAATTTGCARTKHPVSVRTGQSHPAANPRRVLRNIEWCCCWWSGLFVTAGVVTPTGVSASGAGYPATIPREGETQPDHRDPKDEMQEVVSSVHGHEVGRRFLAKGKDPFLCPLVAQRRAL